MKRPKTHPTYVTNPITLLVEGVKRAFKHSQTVAVILIVVPFVLNIVQFIFQIFSEVFGGNFGGEGQPAASAPVVAVGVVLAVFAFVLAVFINIAWSGFTAAGGLAILHRRNESFSLLFGRVLNKLFPTFLTLLLIGIYTLPWWIACGVSIASAVLSYHAGGMYASVLMPVSIFAAILFIVVVIRVYLRYGLSLYALYDSKVSALQAMAESKELTKGRLVEVFGVTTIASVVPFINALLASAGGALLYQQLKDHQNEKDNLPAPHILNYLVIFLAIGFVLLLAAFIGLLIAIGASKS